MFKYIILALVILWLLKARPWAPRSPQDAQQAKPAADKHPSPQNMVVCAHCGVHIPQNEAQLDATRQPALFYCSKAHQLAGPARP